MRAAKRSCLQYSKNIGDLPDSLLVDILCRLPFESAVQCKCVSKHWLGLISDPFFLGRFLCLQSHKQKPIIRPLIFSNTPEPGIDNWTDFSFLPCFQSPSVEEDDGPVVLGSCNDLVLCCATKYYQDDYYICNPRTKKWVALPIAPQSYEKIRVGFICEPLYKEDDVVVGEKGEEELDFEYNYMVVRLISEESTSGQFHMDVFSSKNGRWFKSIVYSRQSFSFDSLADNIGIVHKGMLYWWSLEGFLIGVELDVCSSVKYCVTFCSFIEKPRDDRIGGGFHFLGACRGRMRLCQVFSLGDHNDISKTILRIWELREDDDDHHQVMNERWCLIETLPIQQMISESPICMSELLPDDVVVAHDTTMVLGFDPNNEDILFLQVSQHVFMCNIRAKTVKVIKVSTASRDPLSLRLCSHGGRHQFLHYQVLSEKLICCSLLSLNSTQTEN